MIVNKGCSNCVHGGVCKFIDDMDDVKDKLEEIKSSYVAQPFELEVNCRHYKEDTTRVK